MRDIETYLRAGCSYAEMASLSNPTVSGKVLKEPNNGGKMTYLDMSLGM